MTDVCQNIKTIHRSKYPLLVVLVKDRLNIYPATVIKGHDGAAQAVEKLMQGLDMYLRIKNKDVAEEQSRLEREQIRQEQVEEYEKSLAVDRAKQEELAKQRQREREEELQKQRQEEQKLVRQAELASTLPSEPSESEPNAITIRIRFPTGEHKMRRFRMGEAVNWLVTFVESIGFDMEEHRIWTSDMPKKDLTTFDLSKTFTELNWPRREQVTVEEK
uniref:UBX domain-containing protein n=1 Tax=Ditylenchus dipsaci TaxID=166011 RepID=A0A915DM66_9BILA